MRVIEHASNDTITEDCSSHGNDTSIESCKLTQLTRDNNLMFQFHFLLLHILLSVAHQLLCLSVSLQLLCLELQECIDSCQHEQNTHHHILHISRCLMFIFLESCFEGLRIDNVVASKACFAGFCN